MKSKDRLAELKSVSENHDHVYNDTVEVYIQEQNGGGIQDEVEKIFQEVDKIRGWIHDINANTQLIRALHSDPTYHTNKYLQDQLDSTVTKTNVTGLKICGALRQFEELIGTLKLNDVRARIARLQYATTRQLYVDALTQNHKLLQNIKDAQYSLLQDQMRLTKLEVTEEECQSLLESNNIQMFVDNIEAQTQEARVALREVETRHAELLKIEGSIKEVHELFMQMAHLVADQQELVDTVTYYATQTSEYVASGGQQLLKGNVTRTKTRKKKISLIICLAVGFILVLIVLIMT